MTKDEYIKWITKQYIELINVVANSSIEKDNGSIPNTVPKKDFIMDFGNAKPKFKDFGEPYCG